MVNFYPQADKERKNRNGLKRRKKLNRVPGDQKQLLSWLALNFIASYIILIIYIFTLKFRFDSVVLGLRKINPELNAAHPVDHFMNSDDEIVDGSSIKPNLDLPCCLYLIEPISNYWREQE